MKLFSFAVVAWNLHFIGAIYYSLQIMRTILLEQVKLSFSKSKAETFPLFTGSSKFMKSKFLKPIPYRSCSFKTRLF